MTFNQPETERKLVLNELSENNNEADSQKEELFTILYPKKISEALNKINSAKKKQLLNKKKNRKVNSDNIRKIISRAFFNRYLIARINKALDNGRFLYFFEKFPQKTILEACKKKNNGIAYMTLKDIIINKELGSENNNNYSVIYKCKENEKLGKMLHTTISELFREYLCSDEFMEEINRLKIIKYKKSYINNYIKIAKNFFAL